MKPRAERLAQRAHEKELDAQANPSIGLAVMRASRTSDKTQELPNPTLAQLVRHAEAYGTDCVLEVGEALLNSKDAARLKLELDRIDADRPRKRFAPKPVRRRRSPAETRAAVVALTEDGLVPQAVANRLGLTVPTVNRLLRSAA